jgi:hypothetical protein
MDADDSGELTMALAEVDRLTRENESLRTIATVAMSELTAPQMGRVRDRLAQLDGGESADAGSR